MLKSPKLRDLAQVGHDLASDSKLQIPLHSKPAAEAKALAQLLYSERPKSHIASLPLEQLCLLSNVCHRFQIQGLLGLVDEALARGGADFCPSKLQRQPNIQQHLKPDNVAGLYWDARSKGMEHFQLACARCIGAHVQEVAEAAPMHALGPVLAEAASQGTKQSVNDKRLQFIKDDVELGLGQLRNMNQSWHRTASQSQDSAMVTFSRISDRLKAIL